MIRDLRTARQEVMMWSETLEQRVAKKSDELERAQHQIMHMEKMASLGQLSATVAHELNNPISGMLTYARLVKRELADQPLSDEIRRELERYLDLLAAECMHCGTIVQNMLDFARRTGSEMRRLRLGEVLERSIMLVHHHFEISNVQLTYEPTCNDDEIVADPDQIQQALIAMLVNAVEATADQERGDAAVVVRMRDDADAIVVEIEDNGVGIAKEHIPMLFEPFFSTKGEKRHGVGLGLAVVYGIVNRHRGVIDVDSTPGQGTIFRIRLNRRVDEADRDPTTGRPRESVVLSPADD
jgi:two-component system NtrC family sensor kinase